MRGCLVAPHPQPWLAGIKMSASTMSKRCREQQSASLTCALHAVVVVVADTLLAMPYRTAPPANIVSAAISARSGQSSRSRQEDEEDEEPDEPVRLPAGATWAHRSCTAGPTIPSPPLMALHGRKGVAGCMNLLQNSIRAYAQGAAQQLHVLAACGTCAHSAHLMPTAGAPQWEVKTVEALRTR